MPEATEHATIEIDRVRLVPPSQTPTVRVADRAKGAGPRAPEQMEKPRPKGMVELPEGRPLTKMQVIEIDPEFLLELERGRLERKAQGAGEAERKQLLAARAQSMPAPAAATPIFARLFLR